MDYRKFLEKNFSERLIQMPIIPNLKKIKNFLERQPYPFVRCIRGVVHPYTTAPQR